LYTLIKHHCFHPIITLLQKPFMTMKRLFFITNWGESPSNVLKRYARQTPGCKGKWDNLIGTDDFKSADYYIVLEGSNIDTPIDRTIYIKREPDFIEPVRKLPYKHIIDFNITNGGVTYWLDKTYDELKALTYPNKKKLASCIVSGKHDHRIEYIKHLFRKKLFRKRPNIDLYGRGHDEHFYGDKYKGELNYSGNCKFNGLADYTYTIAIENSRQQNYWTEKLADALLCWCIPIYWGCPNLNDFFPEGSVKNIDIYSKTPVKDIERIINTPITDTEIKRLGECRDLILDKYNIWEVINKKVQEIENNM